MRALEFERVSRLVDMNHGWVELGVDLVAHLDPIRFEPLSNRLLIDGRFVEPALEKRREAFEPLIVQRQAFALGRGFFASTFCRQVRLASAQ